MTAAAGITKRDSVIIVGGSGFIGSHLARRCRSLAGSVLSVDVARPTIAIEGVRYLVADLCDAKSLKKKLAGRAVNYVFNLGGRIDHSPYFGSGREVIDVHLTGLMNLIDSLDRSALKGFVQVGTSDEYGSSSAPQAESSKVSPISPYSFAKLAAGQLVSLLAETEGFPGVTLRLFLVYGPGQRKDRLIPQIVSACLNDERFKTSRGEQRRDLCYIDDVVDALIAAAVAKRAVGRLINIGSGSGVRIKDVVKKIMALTAGGHPVWGAVKYRKGENMELYADISLAKSVLGWKPKVSLEEGLRATITYYQKDRSGRF